MPPTKFEASAGEAANENAPCSAHKVFNVAELFERVLLHVPIQDLLASAPRVCKHWKEMIDSSRCLQQGLFFRPVVGSAKDTKVTWVANPMMYQILSTMNYVDAWDKEQPSSWKEMFVCQPPVYEVDMKWNKEFYHEDRSSRWYYYDHTGIKIGACGARSEEWVFTPGLFRSLLGDDVLPDGNESWERAETPAEVLHLLGVEIGG